MDDPARPPRRLADEIAGIGGGRDVTRGWVDAAHWLQPQDSVLLRRGGGSYELYEDLLRDDRVHATLEQRRRAVVAREWEVRPGGSMRRDRVAAEFLREQLVNVGWDGVTDRMLYGLHYGYSIAEAIYARDGDRVVLAGLRPRNRRRFVFGADQRPRLLTAESPMGEELPPGKFWCWSTGGDNVDDPYGRGLAHQLYWLVWFKRNQMSFWLSHLEHFGSPTPLAKYPRSQSASKQALVRTLEAIRANGVVAVPDDVAVELLAVAGGDVDYAAFTAAMDRAISTVVLGQTMTIDDGSSRSQAEVHLEVRDEIVEADAYLVDDSFSRQVGAWLTRWNFPGAAPPVVARIMETPSRQEGRARRDKLIADLGHRPTAEYVQEAYGVPVEGGDAGGGGDGAEMAERDAAAADAARDALGPLVDGWWRALRSALGESRSLAAFGAALAADAVDAEAVAETLAAALAAEWLRGMSDAADEAGESDMALAEGDGRLPFDERIEFFRAKLSLPTRTWTDIWQDQHDVAFVVAGAARDALLSDLRGAVDAAVADGETLRQFRTRFDRIVAKHGWSYNGGRDWRTRVIYETNLATSYAAGRWRQLREVADRRPFWRYRHSPASVEPREKHVAWDGLILRHDDPWWRVHYPPNGWGCKCWVESMSRREVERAGGAGEAPPTNWRRERVGSGASARVVDVADGVDAGFAHAPGRAAQLGQAVRQRLIASLRQPPAVAAAGVRDMLSRPRPAAALREEWRRWRRNHAAGDAIVVGALLPQVVAALARIRGDAPPASVSVSARDWSHASRAGKDPRLDDADWDRLTEVLASPAAVLYERAEDAILYVFEPAARGGLGKAFVRVGARRKTSRPGRTPRRRMEASNWLRSAGYVQPGNLREARYEVLWGAVPEGD